MSFRIALRASPLLFLVAAASAPGCGGTVVDPGTGGTGTTTGTTTGTGSTTGAAFDACDGPGQCVLVPSSCCGSCGTQSLESMTAVHADHTAAYFESLCPDDVACPACAALPNPNLFAYCESGHCVAADAKTHAVSACTADADCRLRLGADCCEPCDGSADQIIAVSLDNDLKGLVCTPNEGCPKCAVQYPPNAAAWCTGGHCAVVLEGPAD